jgi:hypothetical protein
MSDSACHVGPKCILLILVMEFDPGWPQGQTFRGTAKVSEVVPGCYFLRFPWKPETKSSRAMQANQKGLGISLIEVALGTQVK